MPVPTPVLPATGVVLSIIFLYFLAKNPKIFVFYPTNVRKWGLFMERKDGKKNEETLRIRLFTELLKRIQAAKVPAGWGEEADSAFARHLMIEGLEEIELKNEEKRLKAEFALKCAAKNGSDLEPVEKDA
jgi:hypothetical protein